MGSTTNSHQDSARPRLVTDDARREAERHPCPIAMETATERCYASRRREREGGTNGYWVQEKCARHSCRIADIRGCAHRLGGGWGVTCFGGHRYLSPQSELHPPHSGVHAGEPLGRQLFGPAERLAARL